MAAKASVTTFSRRPLGSHGHNCALMWLRTRPAALLDRCGGAATDQSRWPARRVVIRSRRPARGLMARALWLAGVTGLEAATAALGSVVIESSHRDFGCDGGGLEFDMGILPTGTGLDCARRLRWLVQPGCGCSLRLAGGRWFESHSDDLIDTHMLLQNAKNVNHNLQIRVDPSPAFLCDIMTYPELPRMRSVSRPRFRLPVPVSVPFFRTGHRPPVMGWTPPDSIDGCGSGGGRPRTKPRASRWKPDGRGDRRAGHLSVKKPAASERAIAHGTARRGVGQPCE